MVMVGEAGYPDREPKDTRKLVDACHVVGCDLPATQLHGMYPDLIQTCDGHANEVIEALVELFV